MATTRLNEGERCEGCERILHDVEGGPTESLHEWYEGGNHVCPLGCPSCQDVLAQCTDESLRTMLLKGAKDGSHIHTRFHCASPMAVAPHVLFRKGMEIGALADEKRELYGDSIAQYEGFLKLLWPNGIPVASYRDAGLATRVFDKLMRVANAKDHDGENPWDDAAGYALIGAAKGR